MARDPPPLKQTATLPGLSDGTNSLTVRDTPVPVVGITEAWKEPDAILILALRAR
jgi:hypothetical protein